jgi:hypothetical protein
MHTQRHRHIVAVPIVALAMLLIGGVNHFMPLHAAVGQGASRTTLKVSVDQPFSIGTDITGFLYAGSALQADRHGQSLTLQRGQAIITPATYVVLTVGDILVSFDAPVFVILDTVTTIVALTEPVIVTRDDARFILLAGQQLRVDPSKKVSLSTVPAAWLAETLSHITVPHDTADITRITTETYHSLLQSSDPDTDQRRLLLLRLMSLGARTDQEAAELITADILSDSFLHDALLSLLPHMALSTRSPLQKPLIAAWAQSVIETGVRDATRASLLISQNTDLPSFLEEIGYPVQATLWRSALLKAISTLKPTVSDEDSLVLSQAHDTLTVDMQEEETPLATVTLQPAVTSQWAFDELRLLTKEALVRHGALFATSTALVPDITSQTVLVQGIYVAEQGSDVPYTFTYNPSLQVLSNITRDGERLPNTVPINVFFRS